MPKVYFSADAEFTIQLDDDGAETFAEKFGAGKKSLSLDLERIPPPYGSAIAFFINPENLVDGLFTAQAINKNSVLICMRGIFFIEPKSAYIDMALESDLLWVVEVAKVSRGIKTVKYKDYYGKKTKTSLEVFASKSLKDVRKAAPVATTSAQGERSIAPTASSFEVCGTFMYAQCAKVSSDTAKKIKSGDLSGGDLEELIQSSSDFFSLYGAMPQDVTVKINGSSKYVGGSSENLSWVTDARQREEPPSEIFLKESFALTSLPSGSKYVLTIHELEGSEEYRFNGKYSEKKLSALRIILETKKGESLAEVIQIAYEKADITENTQPRSSAVFLLENGNLRKVR